ncbi:MAG: histidine phosphatase family protein [Gammaproteobacteria bacterium]|nr:histidine phosphatase family protein [Gammaproteobacteria bacterium]
MSSDMTQQEYRQPRFAPPPGSTEVLLVRHGESRAATADNPFPLVDGHGDPELHPNGQVQARLVAERLRHEPVAAIYVSNLRRTSETAAPLARLLGLQPSIDADLREVCLGDWEGGLFRVKAHEQDPVYLRMQAEERWDIIPNGESNEALSARLQGALQRMRQAHPDRRIAAFVHGGVIANILHMATGSRPFAFTGAANGSISHIVLLEDRIMVRSFNDCAHLADTIVPGDSQLT